MHIPTDDLRRALADPLRSLNNLSRWVLLARYAHLPYADVMRYRRELRDDSEFQAHLKRCLADVDYVLPEASLLYVTIRAVKPDVVVETGVASGISTSHILRAMAVNGRGTLHSIDWPNVQEGSALPAGRSSGWMVPDSLRERWHLQLGDARVLLPQLLAALGEVDIFLHDSDHSYEHMAFEFEQALPKLEPGGLLMSDDTHLHPAWDQFCTKHGLRPTRVGHLGVTRKKELIHD